MTRSESVEIKGEVKKRVRVLRRSMICRILLWLFTTEGLILGITGISLSESLDLNFIHRGVARDLHIVTGFALTATAVFLVYYFVASGEYKWYGIRRIPMAIDYFFAEAKAWFKGEHLPEPIRYNPEKGEYEEKIVPTEVLVWWAWIVLGLAIILSGLGLLFPEQFAYFNRFWAWLIQDDIGGRITVATRIAHFISAALILFLFILHVYASWVFKMLNSVVNGYRDEPVA